MTNLQVFRLFHFFFYILCLSLTTRKVNYLVKLVIGGFPPTLPQKDDGKVILSLPPPFISSLVFLFSFRFSSANGSQRRQCVNYEPFCLFLFNGRVGQMVRRCFIRASRNLTFYLVQSILQF